MKVTLRKLRWHYGTPTEREIASFEIENTDDYVDSLLIITESAGRFSMGCDGAIETEAEYNQHHTTRLPP